MRKRSSYRPKTVNPTSGLAAIAMQQWVPDSCTDQLVLLAITQFDALKKGRGNCEAACNTLAQLVNVSLILCEMGVGSEFIDDIKTSQDWLARTFARGNEKHIWHLDGAAFAPVSRAIEIHREQLRNSKRGEVKKAMEEVLRRLDAGAVIEVAV